MRASSAKRSIWTYYVVSVAIVLAAFALLTWYSGDRYRAFFVQHLERVLEDRALIVADRVSQLQSDAPVASQVCLLEGSITEIRLTVVDDQGLVHCDSIADVATMDNHGDRPEVIGALTGVVSSSTRYSTTLSTTLLYVAVPVEPSLPVTRVVRAAVTLESIDNLLNEIKRTLALIGVMLAVGAVLLSIFLYKKVNPPLKDIIEGANRFSQGRFRSKLPDYDVREIAELGIAMNGMATQLERLETIRQDFVSNVSHELRTPITSIKGFLETLQDGAKENPEDLDRFLEILSKQSTRLEAIVSDLLTLSRLESEPAAELLTIHNEKVSGILNAVKDLCQSRAADKGIRISVDCPADLEFAVDQSLITQALTNLTDNAIKYSSDNTKVRLSAYKSNNFVRIDVIDQGSGIPVEHIPRLFERFYRVDKARSRALGGTGLGLSIVKHIAVLHEGSVSVDCPVQGGSVFHLDIPT
ncbi:MAG: ATP-binding protein [Pseudomonadota bacterium]